MLRVNEDFLGNVPSAKIRLADASCGITKDQILLTGAPLPRFVNSATPPAGGGVLGSTDGKVSASDARLSGRRWSRTFPRRRGDGLGRLVGIPFDRSDRLAMTGPQAQRVENFSAKVEAKRRPGSGRGDSGGLKVRDLRKTSEGYGKLELTGSPVRTPQVGANRR
jgi:hypothetical protein